MKVLNLDLNVIYSFS